MSIKWVAGWNPVGYSPESEPAGVESWVDAKDYLVGELDRWWDSAESAGVVEFDFLDAHTDFHSSTDGEPFTVLLESSDPYRWTTALWLVRA